VPLAEEFTNAEVAEPVSRRGRLPDLSGTTE
jgi:hypothetical protein